MTASLLFALDTQAIVRVGPCITTDWLREKLGSETATKNLLWLLIAMGVIMQAARLW